MLVLLLSLSSQGAPPAPSVEPIATATLTADGQYSLRIVPDVSWQSAEVTVDGASTDVGPAEVDSPIEITGWTESIGTLDVRVMALTTDNKGVTWMFQVEPEILPAGQPDMTGAHAKKKPRWWPF